MFVMRKASGAMSIMLLDIRTVSQQATSPLVAMIARSTIVLHAHIYFDINQARRCYTVKPSVVHCAVIFLHACHAWRFNAKGLISMISNPFYLFCRC